MPKTKTKAKPFEPVISVYTPDGGFKNLLQTPGWKKLMAGDDTDAGYAKFLQEATPRELHEAIEAISHVAMQIPKFLGLFATGLWTMPDGTNYTVEELYQRQQSFIWLPGKLQVEANKEPGTVLWPHWHDKPLTYSQV